MMKLRRQGTERLAEEVKKSRQYTTKESTRSYDMESENNVGRFSLFTGLPHTNPYGFCGVLDNVVALVTHKNFKKKSQTTKQFRGKSNGGTVSTWER